MSSQAKLSLHPGQVEVYTHPARFKVCTAGRRWGKCLAEGTMISMADGSERRIESVQAGELVLTVNEDTYELEAKPVQHVLDNGVKETVVVKTSGREIRCTPNHPLLVNNTWIDAGKVKAGDLIAVPKNLAFGNKRMNELDLDILAIWLAEGSGYSISNTTPEILAAVRDYADSRSLEMKSTDSINWSLRNGDRSGGSQAGTKNPLRKLLESFELWGKKSKTKFIPDLIFNLEKDQVARFLNLFFACDGNISRRSKNTWSIECGLANEKMLRQISKLLHKFGVRGAIRHKVHNKKSKITGRNFESWSYVASGSTAIEIFAYEIGCLSKEGRLDEAIVDSSKSRGNCNEYIPITHDEFVGKLDYSPEPKQGLARKGGNNAVVGKDLPPELTQGLTNWRKQSSSRCTIKRYKSIRKWTKGYFDPLVYMDVAWEEVKSVEQSDEAQTWDLTIQDNHNFIAEGVVTHNTALAKVTVIRRAAGGKKRKVWYIAPTFRMAKNIMWDELLDAIPRAWIKKVNHTEMSVTLLNDSKIECKGADKPDSLRGVGLYFVVLDEFQDMKTDVWTKVIRPTLAKDRGHALIIGTPKGYQNLYEVHKLGQDPNNRMWRSWQFPTSTSPFIPKQEIEDAKNDMDPKSYRQEFEASFETMAGRVYYAFDRDIHLGDYAFDPSLPIWVCQDFNVDPMATVIAQPQRNGEVWCVDEIYQHDSNTLAICEEIERRYWRYSKSIVVYPDPACVNRGSARGESDLDIFRDRGFKRIKYRRKHPLIVNRVNSVNHMLEDAAGNHRLKVDKKCVRLVESFEQLLYKPGTRDVDKSQNIEHITDALGYMIELEYPLRKIKIQGASI